jgi:elongation factor G
MMKDGVIAGCEFVDIKVEVYDGKEHPVDSKDVAFQKAGREAFKLAVNAAKPVLLEPIVLLEVNFPSEYTGDIQGDITRRRGRVQGVDTAGDFQTLKALVPLDELSDYAASLGSVTGGQGSYDIEEGHYETAPAQVMQKVVETYNSSRKQEE